MTPIFADTSYYLALLSPRDQYHDAAVRLGGVLRRPVILTEFILLELANFLSADDSRARLVEFWTHLKNEPFVTIVPASSELLTRGFEFFARRSDKHWSLTDCTSFIVMEEFGLSEALTADRHFEQAGFTILL